MNFNQYIIWVQTVWASEEAQAFFIGFGLGVFVQTVRWMFRLLRNGGKTFL